ncbi:MAG: hypothetical protein GX622_04430 [Bacteroidales bacterium]|mgnify:CR=1 FL=1|nr:hypothetical protein [Bacteroidales bacterium]
MDKIYLLTDYKGRFGSKHGDSPYRSGMDPELLRQSFFDTGYELVFITLSKVDPGDGSWKGRQVLYTSSEDKGLTYKEFIEDVILSLEYAGAEVIPGYRYLRANNNKVFMELLRVMLPDQAGGNLKSACFGALEELTASSGVNYPVIVKGSYGAMGRNVFLARSYEELRRIVKHKIVTPVTFQFRLKEYLRMLRHKGYKRDSFYRGEFVVQEYITGLKNDWKIYYFGDRAYVFNRPVFPKREFRASGGGYDNYSYGLEARAPEGMLDFGWKIFRALDVPCVSMDVAWDGERFYLLEFQCVYFGTAGILRKYSKVFFQRNNGQWQAADNEGGIEKTYAYGIAWYLRKES